MSEYRTEYWSSTLFLYCFLYLWPPEIYLDYQLSMTYMLTTSLEIIQIVAIEV